MTAGEMFRISERGDGLGLSCDDRGLYLAGIPLLRCERGRFRPRPGTEIAKLLGSAYRAPVDCAALDGGLEAVANALNEGETARAMIAAVHLRLPTLDWHGGVRILRAEVALAKYDFNPNEPRDWHGRWTTGGDSSAPAVGTPPRPERGRLAPTHLPKPLLHPAQAEDDENSRGGLLGDFMGLPREFRLEAYETLQSRLRDIDPGNPQLESITSLDYSPTQGHIDALFDALRAAQIKAGEPPSTAWELGWSARGIALQLQHLGGGSTLPSNAPVIDAFNNGVVISVKSIDLNAPWYANPSNLSSRIDRYVNQLVDFEGLTWTDGAIRSDEIAGKVLDIVIPKNSGSEAQMRAIRSSVERARRLGISILVYPY
jgi:hypothetical protein